MADSDNNKKVSFRIEDQLPLFVKEDHPQFKNLLEVYYKFMESVESGGTRNALSAARNIADVLDIDYTDTAVLSEFRRQFYSSLPENSVVDIKLFEKNIVDFYRAKGSQRAFEFLFKIVFGIQKIEFRYPKVELLKASSGVWVQENSIHVQSGTPGLENLITKKIIGSISGATAIVEKIEGRLVGQISISELYLKEILGTFLVSEVISDEDNVFQGEVLLGILDKVNIDNPGRGYVIGDPADIINGPAGIIEVSETTNNQVISININNGGTGYELGSVLTINPADGDITGANAEAFITQINFDDFITRDLQIIGPFRNLTLNDLITSERRIIGVSGNTISPKVMYDDGDTMLVGGTPVGTTIINNINGYINSLGTSVTGGDSFDDQFGVAYSVSDVNTPPRWTVGDVKYEQSLVTTNTMLTVGVSTLADVLIIEALEFRTYSVGKISEITVTDFGDFYTNLPVVTAKNVFIPDELVLGADANLSVTSLGGGVVDANIIDPGAGYFGPPDIIFPNTKLENTTVANTANGTVSIQPLRVYEGRYEGTDGQPSSDKVLQDNLFYQDYSYVLQTDRSISDYRDVVKQLLHPSGMELFGEVDIENTIDLTLFTSSNGSAEAFSEGEGAGFLLNLDDPDQVFPPCVPPGTEFDVGQPTALDATLFQFDATNLNTHRGNSANSGGSIDTTFLPGLLGFGYKGFPLRTIVAERPLIDYYAANTISGGSNDAVWLGNAGGSVPFNASLVIGDVVGETSTSFVSDAGPTNLVERIIQLGGLLPANYSTVDSFSITAGQFKLIENLIVNGNPGKIKIDFGPFEDALGAAITGEEFVDLVGAGANPVSAYTSNVVSIADRDLVRGGEVSASIRIEDPTGPPSNPSPVIFDQELIIQKIEA